ncbi:MAG: hypothetical protein ACMUIL_06505 [bacterium]
MTNVSGVGKITIANVKFRLINNIYVFDNLTIPCVVIDFKAVFEKGEEMIFIDFKKKKVSEPDKKEYARIIERIIPVLRKFHRDIFSINKKIDIHTKIIFR